MAEHDGKFDKVQLNEAESKEQEKILSRNVMEYSEPFQLSGLDLVYWDAIASFINFQGLQNSVIVQADFEPDNVTVVDPNLQRITSIDVRGIGTLIPDTDFTEIGGGGFEITYPGFTASGGTAVNVWYLGPPDGTT